MGAGMKHPIRLALLALLTVATVASAQLYPLFGPSTGILKGTVSSPQTSAAASSDVVALWSGTCNSSSFLRGDGVCAGGSGTVTSITAGTGLTGGTITTSGTIALSTPVSATNGGTGEAGTVSGVMKGNNTSAVTAAASSDVIALWTGTCNSTTFLRADGSCQPASGGGSGTVTSVALTMPSGFSVSGSPITNAGTLAVSTSLSGVLKGTGSAFTTAAASDVYALWSGTCNSTTFLRGDGTCAAAGGSGGNATALLIPSDLLLHFDGTNGQTTTVDSSAHAFTVTQIASATLSTAHFEFGTASTEITDSGSGGPGWRVADNAALRFGSNDFVIDLWIYPVSWATGTNNENVLVSKWTSAFEWYFTYNATSGFAFYYNATHFPFWSVTNSATPLNTWSHLMVRRIDSQLYLFINGLSVGTPISIGTGTVITGTSDPVQVGVVNGAVTAGSKDVFVDEVRIIRSGWNFNVQTSAYTQ
jgi:Concanavalin A-like lectin/glucanases superfamily